MTYQETSKRNSIIELVNKLFIYTDSQQWDRLVKEVFKEKVLFDMSSAGAGPPQELTSRKICEMWEQGFQGIDQVYHLAKNHAVHLIGDTEVVEAAVACYAIAIHYKKDAVHGQTPEFIGTYDLNVSFTDRGWRINGFKYNFKFMRGNADLR